MTPGVVILGSGAMASLLGARLSRAEVPVTLAGTWRAGLEAVAKGITLRSGSDSVRAHVRVVHRDDLADGADVVVVLVKGPQTRGAARAAARVAAASPRGSYILTLQNGLGHRDVLARAVLDSGAPVLGWGTRRTSHRRVHQVEAGVTSVGATLVAPGVVRLGGRGSTVIGGVREPADALADAAGSPASADSRRQRVAALLTQAGFDARAVDDVRPWQWQKLAVNAAINPLGALLGQPNGALLEAPAVNVLRAAAGEVGAVARALGVDMPEDPVAAARTVARDTATNRSSMLQDVDAGRPTEIESINGAVVRHAEQVGVGAPTNAWLLEQVRRIEAGAAPAPLDQAPIPTDAHGAGQAVPA